MALRVLNRALLRPLIRRAAPVPRAQADALTNIYPWRVVGDVIHGPFFIMRQLGGFQGKPRFEFHRDALDQKVSFLDETDAMDKVHLLNSACSE